MVKDELTAWVARLEPGKGKTAAQQALVTFKQGVDAYQHIHGFTPGNVDALLETFIEQVTAILSRPS